MDYKGESSVCMICLKSSECTFEDVKAVTIKMLKFLGIDLDLYVNEKSVICKICSGDLEKCFDFKTICLYTEDCVNSFRNDSSNVKLDLEEIRLRKNEQAEIAVPKRIYNPICRLCMEIVEADCGMSLSGETKDVALANIILKRYFSELNLDITKNPVICTSCNESLHAHFNFIKNHLIEDETKHYCKIEVGSNKLQIESNSGLQFGGGNILNHKNGCTSTDVHGNYSENELHDETESKLGNLMVKNEFQELHIKSEINEHAKPVDIDLSNLFKICHEDEQNYDTDCVESKMLEFNIKHEKIDIKSDQYDDLHIWPVFAQDTGTTIVPYSCEVCPYKTKRKGNLTNHMLTHKNISEVTSYSCEICPYKAKQKNRLKQHMLIHKNTSKMKVYTCKICMYKTKRKEYLRRHMVIHKTALEVNTYDCDICTFSTRYKGGLKTHMLMHKAASEVTTYQCDVCTFKTRYISALQRHKLVHRNAFGRTIGKYSCEICMYKAKRRGDLTKHMRLHKTASEVTT